MDKTFEIAGHNVSVNKIKTDVLNKAEVSKILDALKLYKDNKAALDSKIIEHEDWFKGQYWKYISGNNAEQKTLNPTTSFLFNAIWNRHADAMDNYPEPVFLEREADDKEEADKLSKIVPLALEKADFEATYSDVWWYKLKQGAGIYGVFWDNSKENGLGDIAIKKVDLLRVYCEPHITNIQDSRYLFVLSLENSEAMRKRYPKAEIPEDATDMTVKGYFNDYSDSMLRGKTCVIDCYERGKNVAGRDVVHLTKLVGEKVIYSTKTDPALSQSGLYDHGLYPFVTDVFIPVENSPFGMGMIDIAKGTQAQIDKLSYLIERNALIAGRQKWLIKRDSGFDAKQLADMSVDFVECDRNVDDSIIRPVQANPIPNYIIAERQNKINELKELIGNRDFTQGSTTGGVTAYGAITALQEAGSKLSRDMIKTSYRAYRDIAYMVVELIRQFYTEERKFRITGEAGAVDYVGLDNSGLADQPIEQDMPMMPEDTEGMGAQEQMYRKVIFDIEIVPQKKNPFNTISHNQMIMDLFRMGAFQPEMADATATALDAMIFDNKDSLIQAVKEKGGLYEQVQQLMQLAEQQQAQLAQMMGVPPQGQPVQQPMQGGMPLA